MIVYQYYLVRQIGFDYQNFTVTPAMKFVPA
jgi:hypothetical protein